MCSHDKPYYNLVFTFLSVLRTKYMWYEHARVSEGSVEPMAYLSTTYEGNSRCWGAADFAISVRLYPNVLLFIISKLNHQMFPNSLYAPRLGCVLPFLSTGTRLKECPRCAIDYHPPSFRLPYIYATNECIIPILGASVNCRRAFQWPPYYSIDEVYQTYVTKCSQHLWPYITDWHLGFLIVSAICILFYDYGDKIHFGYSIMKGSGSPLFSYNFRPGGKWDPLCVLLCATYSYNNY